MMAAGREKCEWNRTSHVLAWIQNWSGFAESNIGPRELNPCIPAVEGPTIDAADLAVMVCGQAAIDHFAACDARENGRLNADSPAPTAAG